MNVKTELDIASIGVAIATIAEWLPAIAALFTIVWTGLRIVETLCDLGWINCRSKRK